MGKTEEYNKFAQKGKDYKTLWNSKHRLFIPKDADGNFLEINPKLDGGRGYRDYYDENNGWTYAWSVQHDIAGTTQFIRR